MLPREVTIDTERREVSIKDLSFTTNTLGEARLLLLTAAVENEVYWCTRSKSSRKNQNTYKSGKRKVEYLHRDGGGGAE